MKFFNNLEPRTDPFIKLALTDLAKTLSASPRLEVDYAYHSTFKPTQELVTISHYWDRLLDPRRIEGMKSDIYLRAFGQTRVREFSEIKQFLSTIASMKHKRFREQLFYLLEDFRLQRFCLSQRRGMIRAFTVRQALLQNHYRERAHYHLHREEGLDALFCAIYLQMIARPIALPPQLAELKPEIRRLVRDCSDGIDLKETLQSVHIFSASLPESLPDMKTMYLKSWDFTGTKEEKIKLREGHEPLSKREQETKEHKNTYDEAMPSWHQEQEDEGNNFLQFDLDEGAKADLMGEGERQAESGDQAFGSVQGQSQDADGNQYDDHPPLKEEAKPKGSGQAQHGYSDVNKTAEAQTVQPHKPSAKDESHYRQIVHDIQTVQKGLQRSIQKAIEHKQNAARTDLYYGRLGKQLLKVVTEDNPRLFMKKHAESKELDVVFSLLVDSSASMYDKIEETHKGLILFHETLKALHIHHAITGFWEDALKANQDSQPNLFKPVITFDSCFQKSVGARILQLEPEEDNRDGFSIRYAAKQLLQRSEKRKILLIITDGEPSAFNYEDQGIVDTHQAVIETRKKGLEVIGIYLGSNTSPTREKETMKRIYGRSSLVIPTIEDIPNAMIPLLKRLILNHIE
ncbi:hypothetical protein GCM10011391_39850 [Pullulanibacillus camelliae]|uniref:VWFA domain-containing protein n=1 Tax=Pullulanibacillus camelliae TaxID=1707096 RepID=A0A8J2YN92_9BACL|nr:hypothetical protein [Pullulanibacillus camelliae]GGE56985.1 hypothetical protein GCM10011391_39850 [Pullulanibacillus camelliae]